MFQIAFGPGPVHDGSSIFFPIMFHRPLFRWLTAGLILAGLAAFDIAYFGPWRGAYLEKRQLLHDVDAADTLSTAIGMAAADHQRDPAKGIAWPAESGVRTTGDYITLLARGGYLQPEDLPTVRDLVIANLSQRDPPETLLLVSRGAYEKLVLNRGSARLYVLFHKSGESEMASELPPREKLPPRRPAFLPP